MSDARCARHDWRGAEYDHESGGVWVVVERDTPYPAICARCGALMDVATRPARNGDRVELVDVEVFMMVGSREWAEQSDGRRPACEPTP